MDRKLHSPIRCSDSKVPRTRADTTVLRTSMLDVLKVNDISLILKYALLSSTPTVKISKSKATFGGGESFASNAHVMIKRFQSLSFARRTDDITGIGKSSSTGVEEHFVPVDISSGLQTLQLFDSGLVEYSPFEISQREQMPPGALENFPGSHAWQVRAPSELVFPGRQSSQISDGGSVPIVPATHGSEAEQTWLVSLQKESLQPRATGIVVDPSPATTEPALARLQDVPSLLL